MKECDDYRKMSWRDFERMFAEVLRSQGYKVELRGGNMPDDGIDIIGTRNGKVTVIQCKHWKDSRVGIKIVREMYGVMTAEKADEVMIVTTGEITNPCYKFADGKPIHLIDGIRLLEMIKAIQKDGGQPAAEQETTPAPSPKCPKCGSPMVMRKARKGPRAGNNFWGCSMYPRCRASRSIAPDDPIPQDQRK
ncbi:MAG: restriction endonuclease [Candidatus Sumerlaeia bacterium]|nr:restriction endonuclease [Candidatus Sumerlaeia bacterium]